jgi:hypothetical protein
MKWPILLVPTPSWTHRILPVNSPNQQQNLQGVREHWVAHTFDQIVVNGPDLGGLDLGLGLDRDDQDHLDLYHV